MSNALGTNSVKRVHGGHETEVVVCLHVPEPGHMNFAFRQRSDEDVESLLGDAVELLEIQHFAIGEGVHKWTWHEGICHISTIENYRWIVMAHEAARRELSVAFHEFESNACRVRDGSQQC